MSNPGERTVARNRSADRYTIKVFWEAALQNKRLFLQAAILYPLGAISIYLATPFFIGKALGALIIPGADPMHYFPYIVGSAFVGWACNRIGFASALSHQAITMSILQAKALQALMRRSVGFHNNNIGGKLVSDAIDFPSGYNQLSASLLINLLPFVLQLIIGVAIVFTQSWMLGLLVCAIAMYAVGTGWYDSRKRAPLRARRLRATKAVTGHLADAIVNVQTVKTFAREDAELATHQDLNDKLRDFRLNDWRGAAYAGNRHIGVVLLMQLSFVLLVIHLVQQDPHLVGAGIFAFVFTIQLTMRLFEVFTLLRQVEDGFLQASPMSEILQTELEVTDAPDAQALTVAKGAVSLDDVHFRYDDAPKDQAVFESLDLHIAAGEKIGLVGPSGGGKSTLTRLLLRFEDINGGTISIDGQDISKVTQKSLREHIAYVPQEPLLFHRTVRENIAYGNEQASQQTVEAAATAAYAHDFIMELPEGYDTVVGERGVKLSGGQRQRIAIARAILKDAPILLLDEATSALDSESEVLIQQALAKLMQGRTTLVIAHRLSTIQKMDRIIVLENGAISEQGTHKQLLQSKGTYARLWGHQSGGFIED